eukprot:GHVH01001088.1.p1 GENE.GHVH01001088.1~~GHVH01001088.1.p1  ORF type:complete len:207 (-),score=31.11 GHVH01001088.1:1030-1650(-)
MVNPPKTVVCTDLDNTLVVGQDYHHSTPKAIKALLEQGTVIIPVTGRGPLLAGKVLDELGLSIYPGGFHHGAITYDDKGAVLIDKHIDFKICQILHSVCAEVESDPNWANILHDISFVGQGLNHRYIFNDRRLMGGLLLESLGSSTEEYDRIELLSDFDSDEIDLYQVSMMVFAKDGCEPFCLLEHIADRIHDRLSSSDRHLFKIL